MAIRDALLPEFDNEMATTQRVLERVPEDKLGWKPHAKSGTMAWLSGHVASLPYWATIAMQTQEIDVAPNDGSEQKRSPTPGTNKELLAIFEKNRTAAREAIANASDEELMKPWSLLKGGQTIFTIPKIAVVRGFVMNHMIHHRGQLTVYLRLTDTPVPPVYGPTADENPF